MFTVSNESENNILDIIHKETGLSKNFFIIKKVQSLPKNKRNKIDIDRLFKNDNVTIELGMRYGNPSIESALEKFKNKNIFKILVLPLYPQAGSPTNSSTLDEISRVFSKWPWVPNLRFINGYHKKNR